MVYDLGVWLAGLILLLPLVIFGLAWARIKQFYQSRAVRPQQRCLYLIALIAASISTLAYVGIWSWRVCDLYHASLPLAVLLALQRFIYLARAVSLVAIGCLVVGQGPYRIPALLAISWVTFQLWINGSIIHWA